MRAKPRKRTILLALTSTHHGFYRGAARYAAEHDWHVVADMIYDATIPVGWRGDGILSFVGHWEELAKYVISAGVPVVEISSVRKDLGIPCVMEDNQEIGRLGAEHLLERNFKNFVWAPFCDDAVNEERFQGFAALVRSVGFDCVRLLPVNTRRSARLSRHVNWTLRRRWVIHTIQSLRYPLGIFCYNDCVAADLVDACIEAGIQIPDQVAVLGVDNDPVICDCVQVPLSSVRHDLEGMAYEAAALLDRLINGERPPKMPKRIPPKGVVTRKSTEVLAVEDPKVSAALRYIQGNFSGGNLSVDDVVAHCGVPRRSLERAFRKELERTMLHEILRVRINHAQKLLETTPLSVTDIAAQSGFASLNHFFRVFHARTGLTPRAFRLARGARSGSAVYL
ncbi:MAG: XylR family transcriptional regulator [Verrucomicrobia bacterium]|nr:XylR family transcriptional regulator [Verrucomicrobiota bacterium]